MQSVHPIAEPSTALMSALTTEHFVLQTAASATINEAGARSSLYVFTLSSSLVAMGFMAQSTTAFMPFVAAVIPAVFVLGVFSVVRLVDTTVENMQYVAGIARIRRFYRTLSPEAAELFAPATGRWPEVTSPPSHALGPLLAFFGTTASMIAVINNVVAGAGVALLVHVVLGGRTGVAIACGAATTAALTALFIVYERWRFARDPGVRAAQSLQDELAH
jgi:hypothetical protein